PKSYAMCCAVLAPQFSVDEHALVYLDTWSDGSLRVRSELGRRRRACMTVRPLRKKSIPVQAKPAARSGLLLRLLGVVAALAVGGKWGPPKFVHGARPADLVIQPQPAA